MSVPALTAKAPLTVRAPLKVQVEPGLLTVKAFKVLSVDGKVTAVVPTTVKFGGVVLVIVALEDFVQVPLSVTVAAAVLKVILELSFWTISPR